MGRNIEIAAAGLGEVGGWDSPVLTPPYTGGVRDPRGGVMGKLPPYRVMTALPNPSPTANPGTPLGSFTPQQGAPSLRLWVTAWPWEDSALTGRTTYLLGGLVLLSWVQLQRRRRRAGLRGWVCRYQGASSLARRVCVCTCADIPDTSHPKCPSCGAGQGGQEGAQGHGQDSAGSPGDAPRGCRALQAEAGGHPAPQKLLPTWHQAPRLCTDSLALRSSTAMLGPSRENAYPSSLPISP